MIFLCNEILKINHGRLEEKKISHSRLLLITISNGECFIVVALCDATMGMTLNYILPSGVFFYQAVVLMTSSWKNRRDEAEKKQPRQTFVLLPIELLPLH